MFLLFAYNPFMNEVSFSRLPRVYNDLKQILVAQHLNFNISLFVSSNGNYVLYLVNFNSIFFLNELNANRSENFL